MSIRTSDPEHYQEPSDCVDVPEENLRQAWHYADETYRTCGGHWRAARMESAMKSINAELTARGLAEETR